MKVTRILHQNRKDMNVKTWDIKWKKKLHVKEICQEKWAANAQDLEESGIKMRHELKKDCLLKSESLEKERLRGREKKYVILRSDKTLKNTKKNG